MVSVRRPENVAKLRIVARRGGQRVADLRAARAQKIVARHQLVRRRRRSARDDLVVALHRRIAAERRRGDRARADLRRGAGRRAPGSSSTRRASRAASRTTSLTSANRRVGVERQRSLRREAELEAARQQQIPERRAHAARQHHHVEQHRRGHGDAEDREQRAAAVSRQCGPGEAKQHQADGTAAPPERAALVRPLSSSSGGTSHESLRGDKAGDEPEHERQRHREHDDARRHERERQRRSIHAAIVPVDDLRRRPTPSRRRRRCRPPATSAASTITERTIDRARCPSSRSAATSRRRSSTLSSMMQSRKIALATIVITPIAR